MSSLEKLIDEEELPQPLPPWSETAAAARLFDTIVSNPDCGLVRHYIRKGCDCKAQQREEPRYSLLHVVAELECADCDKVKLVQSLISKGAALDAKDCDGVTPLMAAAVNNNDGVAAALLEAGANVHAVCEQEWTALHYAADSNSTNVVSMLLVSGASAAAVCEDGELPLHYACRQSDNTEVSYAISVFNASLN
jgi:ankyrin repeat protein